MRTIRDVVVHGKNLENVKNHVAVWLAQNEFSILDWQADGSEKIYGMVGGRVRIRPHIGSIVAVQYKISGVVVFEISLKPISEGTSLHGEFYAAGASLFAGDEYDLSPNPPFVGSLPRKRGYKILSEFMQSIQTL